MTPTNEQILAEADRRWMAVNVGNAKIGDYKPVTHYIIEVVREGWKPPEPEPVDPDLLAFREWMVKRSPLHRESIMKGEWDFISSADLFLAGARMATERERERAKVLVEFVRSRADHVNPSERARAAIAKYEEGQS